MGNLDVKASFSFALERMKGNPLLYIVGPLMLCVISIAVVMVVVFPVSFAAGFISAILKVPVVGMLLAQLVSFVVEILVSAPLLLGYYKTIRKDIDEGNASLVDFFSGLRDFVPAVGFYFAFKLAVTILCVVLILPGLLLKIMPLYFAGLLVAVVIGALLSPIIILGFYHLAAGQTGGFGLDAGVKALKGWTPVLAVLVFFIFLAATIVGVLACCVGLIVTYPFSVLMSWHLCRQSIGGSSCGCGCSCQAPEGSSDIGTPS